MSYRLLVNPGTPQAWEIQLRPGPNRIGRGEENDFTLSHESVSGAHCEITVNDAGIFLKDLGSTNGTFVNRAPVTEVQLQHGQRVQVGQVDMTFETGAAMAVAMPPPPGAIPIPVPLPGGIRPPTAAPSPVGMRIAKAPAEEPAPPEP